MLNFKYHISFEYRDAFCTICWCCIVYCIVELLAYHLSCPVMLHLNSIQILLMCIVHIFDTFGWCFLHFTLSTYLFIYLLNLKYFKGNFWREKRNGSWKMIRDFLSCNAKYSSRNNAFSINTLAKLSLVRSTSKQTSNRIRCKLFSLLLNENKYKTSCEGKWTEAR